MLFSINPTSYQNAIDLIRLGIERITIGDPLFSCRNSCNLSIDEIKKVLSNKNNTKVIILVNKIFFENELVNLEKYLIEICQLDIDGIEFADYAVLQILHENNLSKKIYTIYNPETLVVSYQQFPFYLQNDINEVFVARELNQHQINEIGKNKGLMNIGIQVCGYSYMMQSRWDLLSNFNKSHPDIKLHLANQKLFLQEEHRNSPYIIYEDKDGTHNFTGYNLNLISCINEVFNNKVDVCRIETFLHDENWTIQVAKIFIKISDDLKNKNLTQNKLDGYISQFNTFDNEYQSCGFYRSSPEDLIYLEQYQKGPNND